MFRYKATEERVRCLYRFSRFYSTTFSLGMVAYFVVVGYYLNTDKFTPEIQTVSEIGNVTSSTPCGYNRSTYQIQIRKEENNIVTVKLVKTQCTSRLLSVGERTTTILYKDMYYLETPPNLETGQFKDSYVRLVFLGIAILVCLCGPTCCLFNRMYQDANSAYNEKVPRDNEICFYYP